MNHLQLKEGDWREEGPVSLQIMRTTESIFMAWPFGDFNTLTSLDAEETVIIQNVT